MSDRERWIVYPLLFLALGISLRDKMTGTLTDVRAVHGKTVAMDFENGGIQGEAIQIDLNRGVIRCRNLVVTDENGRPQVVAGTDRYARDDGEPDYYGSIKTYRSDGRLFSRLGPEVFCKVLHVSDDENKPLVVVGPLNFLRGDKPDHAGAIKTYGSDGQPQAQLGPVLLCHEMHIVDGSGKRRLVSLVRGKTQAKEDAQETGQVIVSGTEGPVVSLSADTAGQAGEVVMFAGKNPQTVIRSNERGGQITLLEKDAKMTLALGQFPEGSGLIAVDAQGRQISWLPVLRPRQPDEEQPKPGEPPEPENE